MAGRLDHPRLMALVVGGEAGVKFGKSPMLPYDRIMEKVEKLADAPGCWLYTGCVNAHGYGWVSMRPGNPRLAHRVVYEYWHGNIGDLMVLHRCDVPCCVNPSHLFLGTQCDNMRDAARKGRTKPTPWRIKQIAKKLQAVEIQQSTHALSAESDAP